MSRRHDDVGQRQHRVWVLQNELRQDQYPHIFVGRVLLENHLVLALGLLRLVPRHVQPAQQDPRHRVRRLQHCGVPEVLRGFLELVALLCDDTQTLKTCGDKNWTSWINWMKLDLR